MSIDAIDMMRISTFNTLDVNTGGKRVRRALCTGARKLITCKGGRAHSADHILAPINKCEIIEQSLGSERLDNNMHRPRTRALYRLLLLSSIEQLVGAYGEHLNLGARAAIIVLHYPRDALKLFSRSSRVY